jgi:hypothetical protein
MQHPENSTPETREICRIVEQIRPMLAGRTPEVQGGVLTYLMAIWLAGHSREGDEGATRKLRADLLAIYCRWIRKLTTLYAEAEDNQPS